MKKIDWFLRSIPQPYIAAGILSIDALVLYVDLITGPRIPFTIFYLALIYFSLKYAGSRFAYVFVFVTALGKTYVKNHDYNEEISLLLELWQFISIYSLYTMICYLLNTQMLRRKQAEVAFDELSNLNQSIISETDSGVIVFKASGECVLANGAAARILGGTLEQIQQANFKELESWQNSGLLAAAEEALCTGTTQKLNSPIRTSYGKNIWCITSLGRIDRKNAQPYLLLVFTDVTAFREAELAMQQAHKTVVTALDRANAAERRILSISEDTQQRIGQELHDDLGQHLTGIAFMSEVLYKKMKYQGHADVQDASKITTLINEAISKTRKLAQGLYPVELKEAGLPAMLRRLASRIEEIYPIDCVLICKNEYEIDDSLVVINLYRIAQEAVNNAVKHSGATKITIELTLNSSSTKLEITDNGCGVGKLTGVDVKDGLGMHSMRYRVSLLGADLHIGVAPGGGTRIAIILPVQ